MTINRSMTLRLLTATLACLVLVPLCASAQFRFLPGGLHFAPLKANLQEARIGVFKFLDKGEMKVDVGNSIDLFGYGAPGELSVSAGIDFFAYAYTTGAQGLRLQIDAIDGFFGGNLTLSCGGSDSARTSARLRLLHHSAHLVDGHYSLSQRAWLDGREPVAYTRDFGELVVARTDRSGPVLLRPYAGFSYATLARPALVRRFAYLAGVEASTPNVVGPLWSQPVHLFAAYQATVTGLEAYAATHQLQAGVKFGEWYGKGPTIYLGWYHGRHMFAEYFDRSLTTLGAGFTVDFF
jgi:hypothetical protein